MFFWSLQPLTPIWKAASQISKDDLFSRVNRCIGWFKRRWRPLRSLWRPPGNRWRRPGWISFPRGKNTCFFWGGLKLPSQGPIPSMGRLYTYLYLHEWLVFICFYGKCKEIYPSHGWYWGVIQHRGSWYFSDSILFFQLGDPLVICCLPLLLGGRTPQVAIKSGQGHSNRYKNLRDRSGIHKGFDYYWSSSNVFD